MVELLLSVDRSAGGVRAQLEAGLREAIRSGALRRGVRVPSSRSLAGQLGVARGTVVEAYAQLVAEGWLISERGSGTRVAPVPSQASGPGTPDPGVPQPDASGGTAVDFRTGAPALSTLPRRELSRAFRQAVWELSDADWGYSDPRGLPSLRLALADYLGRVRGAVVDPECVVVTSGFAQATVAFLKGLDLKRMAVEDPGSRTVDHLGMHGVEAVGVRVDGDGLIIGELERSGCDHVLVTPAHQFPTGAVLGPQRRAELVAWAGAKAGRLVLEDDYDAEFRYDREPVGCVQGLAPQHVALAGSASKTLAPGLRLGWIVLPPAYVDAVAGAKWAMDLHTSTVLQAAFARLLTSGEYDRHLRRMRPVYRARREALLAAVARRLPGVEVTGIAAGLHAVLELPPGADEGEAVAAAAQAGVAVEPRGAPWLGPGLVVGYGHLTEAAIARGIAALVRAHVPLRGG